MSDPFVSFVMPVHDGERFLAGAIESVLCQTMGDLELVVVDDGSSDASAEIVRRAAARDRRVRLVQQSRAGLPVALNTGLETARGTWIARLDSDDQALPHRLARQLEVASRRPEVVVWAAWADTVDVAGRVIGQVTSGPATDEEFRRAHAAGFVEILHPTVLARREVLLRVGGYDTRFHIGEDVELWDRVGDHGLILTHPERLIRFRVHPESESTRRLAESVRVHRFVAARRAARAAGTDLRWEGFLEAEAAAPLSQRLARSLAERAAVAYRRAGVAYASGNAMSALPRLLLAALLRPAWVVRRLWRQLVAPRLRGRQRTP